jgi:hypothetical protein
MMKRVYCIVFRVAAVVTGTTLGAEAQVAPSLTRQTQIGVLQGDSTREFGWISGLAISPAANAVIIVDGQKKRVSAFAPDGRLISATGRRGSGPGEFLMPFAPAFRGDTLHVVDAGNARISTYVLRESNLALQGHSRLPIGRVSGMCILDDAMFLLGLHDRRIVHRLTPLGAVSQSFGEPLLSEHPVTAARSAVGELVCDSQNRLVIFVSQHLGIVRAYSPEGRLLWQTQLPGFVPPIFDVMPGGGLILQRPKGRSHADVVPGPPVLLPDGATALIQFGSVEQFSKNNGSLADITKVTSVRLDLRTGAVTGTTTSLPRLHMSAGQLVYGHSSDPYPRVEVYRWR